MFQNCLAKAHDLLGSVWNSGYWRFFGPAMIASVAYVDPGNFGTDIAGGASYGYLLVWSVLLANLMAMLLQYLSGKLGIATGMSLAAVSIRNFRSSNRLSRVLGRDFSYSPAIRHSSVDILLDFCC
jgi:Mn2+/Fe2+ NRAMP family transporter